MGGIYRTDSNSIQPTLKDAVSFNPECKKPARFMFESVEEAAKRESLKPAGRRSGAPPPAFVPEPTPSAAVSYVEMERQSGMADDPTIGGEHEYVNDNEIDEVLEKKKAGKTSDVAAAAAAARRPMKQESEEGYEDVMRPGLDGVQSYVNGDVAAAHAAIGRKPTIEDGPVAWAVGRLSRDDCKDALTAMSPGCFVVRESTTHSGAFVLVGRRKDKVVERKIAREDGQYLISQPQAGVQAFDTLIELLQATSDIATTPVARALVSTPGFSDGAGADDYKGDGPLPPEVPEAYVNLSPNDLEQARARTLSDAQAARVRKELASWEGSGDVVDDEDF